MGFGRRLRYNNEHRHSKLNFVTPSQRHEGKDAELLKRRQQVMEEAKRLNPERWSKGVRNCEPVEPVTLNPDKETELLVKKAS